MFEFTEEEKRHVILHVSENQGDCKKVSSNEEMWRNLGGELNRDWMEIRDAYLQWDTTEKSESAALTEAARVENNENNEVLDQEFDLLERSVFWNLDNAELQHTLNEKYVENESQDSEFDQNFRAREKKRSRDLSAFDEERLEILKKQSKEELEMKRKEQEQKMKFYSLQMKNCAEIHHQKMKIYSAKYQGQVDKIHEIDEAICNKSLTKKYKNGTA